LRKISYLATFVVFLLIGTCVVTVLGVQDDIKKYDEDCNNLVYIKIFEQLPDYKTFRVSDAYFLDKPKVYENLWGVDDDIVKLTWWGCTLQWTGDEWINGTPEGMNFFIFFYDDWQYIYNPPPVELIKSFDFPAQDIDITHTGEYFYPNIGGTFEVIKFECLLSSPISLSDGNGWISIQSYNDTENDNFIWLTGSGGDNFSYQENGNQEMFHDMSICLYRIDEPPDKPTITGKTSGKPRVEYEYKFISTDPEGDNIEYCIDWGDNSGEICIGPYKSGVKATATHSWSKKGSYVIKAKARDVYGAESDWSTFPVSMPKNRMNILLNSFLDRLLYYLSFVSIGGGY